MVGDDATLSSQVPPDHGTIILETTANAYPNRQAGPNGCLQHTTRVVDIKHHFKDENIDTRISQRIRQLAVVRDLLCFGRDKPRIWAGKTWLPGQCVRHTAGNRHWSIWCNSVAGVSGQHNGLLIARDGITI